MLLFTSGTSAAPKAAVLEHDQLLAYVFNTLEFGVARVRTRRRIMSSPPFHIAGVAAVLSSTYSRPAHRAAPRRALLRRGLDRHRRAASRSRTRSSCPRCWPASSRSMEADRGRAGPEPAEPGRTAAPACPRRCSSARSQLFPETDFVNAYGLTETSSTVALLGPDDHRLALYSDDPLFDRTPRRRSASRVPGIEIRIVDADRRRRSAPTTPGEIQIRGDQVSGDYVGTDSKIDADGWLHTGDRGWLDVEGYLFCEGRADDTIIRGGENIGPAEIEDALLTPRRHLHRRVVGLADEEWGERIAADDHAAARRRRDRHRARARLGARARRLAQDARARSRSATSSPRPRPARSSAARSAPSSAATN